MTEPILDYSEFSKFADEVANQFPRYAMTAAKPAMMDAADYLLGQVPEYPEERFGALEPPDGVSWLRTDQQRKWFFASVRDGKIPGWKWVDAVKGSYDVVRKDPRNTGGASYNNIRTKHTVVIEPAHPEKIGGARTGNLGRAQGRDIVSTNEYVSATLGFDSAIAPYAPWVVGEDYPGEGGMYQARIHVDNWWQFGSIMDENIEAAWKVFDETFWEEFSKLVNK